MNNTGSEAFQQIMDNKENTSKEKSEFRSLGFILMVIALVLTVLLGIKILIG